MTDVRGRRPTRHAPHRVARRRTRPAAAAELYDTHARDLLGLAKILLADRRDAEAVVVHVLRGAGSRRRAADDRGDRHTLAREVYLRATRSRLGPSAEPRDREGALPRGSPDDLGWAALSDQQRAVIALSLYGEHSHFDTAALLALPTSVVDELLRSGLHRIGVERP